MTLAEFLLARIAEDEKAAADCDAASGYTIWEHDSDGEVGTANALVSHPVRVAYAEHIAKHDPFRVLAECEAKRRIVALSQVEGTAQFPNYEGGYESGWEDASSDAVRLLALPYADHPDYQPEWRV